jgi:hypothetical protein
MSPPPLIILAIFVVAVPGRAAVVNIDFSEFSTPADRFSGLAAAPDVAGSSSIWNNVVGAVGSLSGNDLVTSSGTPTTWDLGITGFLNTRKSASEQEVLDTGTGAGPYTRLMEDYLQLDSGANTSAATASGLIGGLVAGASYDLYFYGQGSDMIGTDASSSGENSLFTVNSVSKQTGWDGVDGGDRNLVEGIEYVKFTTVADSSGRISFTWSNVVAGVNVATDNVTSNTGTGSRFGALNGIQIVGPVPEPSVMWMTGQGTTALLLKRRRRKAK